MENQVDLPAGQYVEAECHSGNHLFYFKWAGSLHLEFLGSSHMEIGCLQPDLVSYLPRRELGCNSFLHLLLGHCVGGWSIVLGRG